MTTNNHRASLWHIITGRRLQFAIRHDGIQVRLQGRRQAARLRHESQQVCHSMAPHTLEGRAGRTPDARCKYQLCHNKYRGPGNGGALSDAITRSSTCSHRMPMDGVGGKDFEALDENKAFRRQSHRGRN